eukprot:m.461224 g.461224  ORF g.461224 m.461224 type:complete len:372 (-) comp22247_c0_seq1:229-1344(-)
MLRAVPQLSRGLAHGFRNLRIRPRLTPAATDHLCALSVIYPAQATCCVVSARPLMTTSETLARHIPRQSQPRTAPSRDEEGDHETPLTEAERVAEKAVQDFASGKIEFKEMEKILDSAGFGLGGSDHVDDGPDDPIDIGDLDGSDNPPAPPARGLSDDLGEFGAWPTRQKRPQTQEEREAVATSRVLDDPDVMAVFDRQPDEARERPSGRAEKQELQELITFRLGRMPDTVAEPGSGIVSDGMNARGKVRGRRIGAMIQKTLTEALRRGQLGPELPDLALEIDEVECTKGLRTATVWWHSDGNRERDAEVEAAIRGLRGRPRSVVARGLNLKFTPQLLWKPTTVRDRSVELDELFGTVTAELEDAKERGLV